jgi:hypothetical protein
MFVGAYELALALVYKKQIFLKETLAKLKG